MSLWDCIGQIIWYRTEQNEKQKGVLKGLSKGCGKLKATIKALDGTWLEADTEHVFVKESDLDAANRLMPHIGDLVWYRTGCGMKGKGILKAVLNNGAEIEDSPLETTITYVGNVFLAEEELDEAMKREA